MNKTSLYDIHKKNGAKLVEFAGWIMPLEYEGLRKEHLAVRSSVGLFDVSHMGEIEISGTDAGSFSQFLSSNDIKMLDSGQAQYSLLCNKAGGVVDDVIFYKFSEEYFLICVNASNTDKDFQWITNLKEEFGFTSDINDKSSQYSQIAVQGPQSIKLLQKVLGEQIMTVKRFRFIVFKWNDCDIIAARTGYTGEEGFEIFLPWDKGPALLQSLILAGEHYDVKLCGLGCRDTLRIEAGYPLYGHEIDVDINPLEAGLGRFVKLDSDDFIGKRNIINMIKSGNNRKLIGFVMIESGIPRHGYNIFNGETVIGRVTSGTYSPSLNKPIGMGLINTIYDKNNLCIDIRNKKRKIELVDIPFYKKQ